MKELIQRKIYPVLVCSSDSKSRLDVSSTTHQDIVRLRKPNTALLIDHSPCRTEAVPCLAQLARGCYAPFGQHQGLGDSVQPWRAATRKPRTQPRRRSRLT